MASESAGPTISIFENFRNELDEHHDRHEQHLYTPARSRHQQTPPPKIAQENQSRLDQIHALFTSIVPDVTGINSWRYQRQISGGIQEFIEAISFEHYLRTQTLISLPETQARLPIEILVTEEDYLMGLFDLTGEMMRFAVMALSSGNATQTREPPQGTEAMDATQKLPHLSSSQAGIVIDLRFLRAALEALSVPRRANMFRDLAKKVEVMQNSVEKVERAAYGILVRGSERPSGWMPDLSAPVEMEIH
ncbi:hypothetical protein N7456_012564 [Penicillium angulare]|uniref:Translin n=1 Tax=Penicillium angulare TaxID=116970 RepID=A0A9W9EJV9_9EURO|nr:hypothetical protein N7456_012564 [Penicillium angulare]